MKFSDAFCQQHQLPAEAFERTALKLALYPPARLLHGFLRLIPGYFSADLTFIRNVGQLRRRRDFGLEEIEFQEHPANRRFIRRHLKLRVSAGRLHRLVLATWPEREFSAGAGETDRAAGSRRAKGDTDPAPGSVPPGTASCAAK